MPKKTRIEDLQISKAPTIEVIGYNHRAGCKFPETHQERDCRCYKYLSIAAAKGETYRVSSGYESWEKARAYARQLETDLSPEVRRQKGQKVMSRVTIAQAFDAYIHVKQSVQDQQKLAEYGPNAAIGKFRTLKRDIEKFLADWNQRPRSQKRITPDDTVDRIEYLDELTTFWLDQAWRPSWFKGKGTYHSKNKRRDLVIEFGHWAQKNGYMPDTRSRLGNHCECLFCNMTRIKKNTEDVSPTPPFELWQYSLVVDSCALYEASYRDLNTEQLRVSNNRLRAFIEVMRHCGSRISDTSLMCKEDIHYDRSRSRYIWQYFPIKNKRKKAVQVTVPDVLVEALKALTDEPGFDPRYYFWSGLSLKRNAPDPWQRALTRLWTLCPAEAKQVYDKRNKQKLHPTSHMFRNTFCVQCRIHGMPFSEIAEAIGDTEKVVRDHYSAYCEDYDRQVLDGVARMQAAGAEAAGQPVEVLKARSRGEAAPPRRSMVQ